ncbi:hypothetical protein KUL152_27010 [Tenacibaculum sp. KUL152]|nr:hypothetical protein KUL152_27010 [Tenacibaculum sp. KUL152]
MSSFSNHIAFSVLREVAVAKQLEQRKQYHAAFIHLENAHVLGQSSTRWHVYTHVLMLKWGFKQHNISEVFGQVVRILGAASKTVFGLVPAGNTGGSNISPFKRLPIAPALQRKITRAQQHSD